MITIMQLARELGDFLRQAPINRISELGDMPIYDQPLVGTAAAADPLFVRLQEENVVGPHHLTPGQWLRGARTVVSVFLPFSPEVRESNREEGLPSQAWLHARIQGEERNRQARRFLCQLLEDAGFATLAPPLDNRYAIVNDRSNWSERHAAYICGLGTFGLSKSLITAKGAAGRLGSVVTAAELPVAERPYQDIYDYCTFCGECIQRCPSGAIKASGKDIPTCARYLSEEIMPRFAPRYGCGKCQTYVACQDGIPG